MRPTRALFLRAIGAFSDDTTNWQLPQHHHNTHSTHSHSPTIHTRWRPEHTFFMAPILRIYDHTTHIIHRKPKNHHLGRNLSYSTKCKCITTSYVLYCVLLLCRSACACAFVCVTESACLCVCVFVFVCTSVYAFNIHICPYFCLSHWNCVCVWRLFVDSMFHAV